jgi:hypothetical protein
MSRSPPNQVILPNGRLSLCLLSVCHVESVWGRGQGWGGGGGDDEGGRRRHAGSCSSPTRAETKRGRRRGLTELARAKEAWAEEAWS